MGDRSQDQPHLSGVADLTLPGIGHRYELRSADGSQLVVVVHHSGGATSTSSPPAATSRRPW